MRSLPEKHCRQPERPVPIKVEEDKKITRGDVSWGYVRHLLFQGNSSGKVGQNGEETGRDTGTGRVI